MDHVCTIYLERGREESIETSEGDIIVWNRTDGNTERPRSNMDEIYEGCVHVMQVCLTAVEFVRELWGNETRVSVVPAPEGADVCGRGAEAVVSFGTCRLSQGKWRGWRWGCFHGVGAQGRDTYLAFRMLYATLCISCHSCPGSTTSSFNLNCVCVCVFLAAYMN